MKLIKSKGYPPFAVFILLAGAIWIWLSIAPSGSTIGREIPAPQKGFFAPNFTLDTPDGDPITLSEFYGQPVLINLWASWCGPCRAEMPAIQRIYDEYQDEEFIVLAINATNQDSASSAINFANEHGLTFPILLDQDGEVSKAYQLRALPSTFFVGKDGIIQEVVIGGPMAEALLRTRVERLIGGTP